MIGEREARRSDGARRRRPGTLVTLRTDALATPWPGLEAATEIVCLNAVRHGKGFLNHYLVPLDPAGGDPDALPLVYIDYNLPLADVSATHALELVPVEGIQARIGQVLENASGRYLKTVEPYKDAFSLGYVDLDSGEVRRRQERGVTAVYDWRIVRKAAAEPVDESVPDPHTGLSLRPMTVADVEPVAALCAACGLGEVGALARRLHLLAESPLLLARVAERGGRLIGAALAVHDGAQAWLSSLAVAVPDRRQGIGRALVSALAVEARRQDLSALNGTTGLGGAAFAGACGFAVSGAVPLEIRVKNSGT